MTSTSGTFDFLPLTDRVPKPWNVIIDVDDPKCVVYVAINLINNKIYVGATDNGLASRTKQHLANARAGRVGKFYNALRKYGASKFFFMPIVQCNDFSHALEEERLYISTMKPQYNLTAGGGGTKGMKHSAEARERMSLAKRGKQQYRFTAEDIAKSIRRRREQALGVKITDPVTLGKLRQNAILANAARIRSVESGDGAIFSSVSKAAAFFGVTTGQVSRSRRYGNIIKRAGVSFRHSGKQS